MNRRFLQLLTMVLALLWIHSTAGAQSSSALEHFDAAQEDFDAGRYLEAALEYKSAYAAAPDKHALLYNIGLAYHRAGRISEALESYERYLELAPDGKAVDEVREYVAEFRKLLGRQETGLTEETVEKAPEETQRDTATHAGNENAGLDSPAPVVSKRRKQGPMGKTQRTGWLVGGGGVGLLLAGVGTGLWASKYEADVERIYHTGNAFPDGKNSRGKILSGLTIGLASAGGAALITGAALIWWGREFESEPTGDIALAPFSNGVEALGLSASGFF